ncbi:MAG: iron chelate uptake ABC transporter family permease subunit, partial [Acidimicrobiia bacterium]
MSRSATSSAIRPSRPGWPAVVIGVASVIVVGAAGLLLGAAGLDVGQVIRALVDALPFVSVQHGLTEIERSVLFEIRAPRIVLGGMVGASLAIAGASYQGVFRNPLADPYLLGVAAGSGLGATIAFALSGDSNLLAPFAFLGGMVAVAVTYALGRSVG